MQSDLVLQIPEEQQPRLLWLARADVGAYEELADALSHAPMRFRTGDLIGSMPPLSQPELRNAVESLRELAMVRAGAEVELDEFVDDVVGGMAGALGDRFTESDRVSLGERLRKLLGYESIAAPAKARSLLVDHANYLCRARILTDVRPVFGPDVEQTPATALVVHTLKLSYHQGSSLHDFFVVLDRRDLDELSELIERAKNKENSLHAMLGAAGLDPLQTN